MKIDLQYFTLTHVHRYKSIIQYHRQFNLHKSPDPKIPGGPEVSEVPKSTEHEVKCYQHMDKMTHSSHLYTGRRGRRGEGRGKA